jgi:uncharacterized membrane protein
VNRRTMQIKIKTDFPISLHIAVFGYITFFVFYSLLRHYEYLSLGYDLGIFMQSLWTTANGEGFFFNTGEWLDLGVSSHFGVHNQPILILLVPLYRLFPYAETLLLIQTFALGFAAYPLFLLTKTISNSEKKALFISLLYLLNPGVHGINAFDFHPVSLAVPFIFLTAYFIEKKATIKALISSLVVLSVKEDAGLALISLGLFFLLKDYELRDFIRVNSLRDILQKEKLPVALIVIGTLWILISVFIIIPHFNPHGYPYFSSSTKLGSVYYGSMTWKWGERLNLALGYTLILLASVVFLPLIRPRWFLSTLPLWAENLLSNKITQLIIGYQYTYMLVPVMLVISGYVLAELNLKRISFFTLKKALIFTVIVSLLFSPALHVLDTKYVNGYSFQLLVDVWAVGKPYFHAVQDTIDALNRDVGICPIVTQNYLFPHFANRKETYYIVTPFKSTYTSKRAIYVIETTRPDYNRTIKFLENHISQEPPIIFNVTHVVLKCYGSDNPQACVESEVQKVVEECRVRNSQKTSR